MKLLHLADLHIGKRVCGFSMLSDQEHILQEVIRLAVQEKVDAVLLAGDLYDKPIPPAEAVSLLDDFFTALSQAAIPVFAITGNHDSPTRLRFGTRLMQREHLYLAADYQEARPPVTLQDAFGPVQFYLLPYIKPARIHHVHPEVQVDTYEDAVAFALQQWKPDTSQRNVLLAHQFLVGGTVCESEERAVGGLDEVSARLFDAFDYVALGHLHGPQKIGRETLRYSGSPLKYSLSEYRHQKSVCLVELGEKGKVTIQTLPLHPLRDLRQVRGTYEEVTARSFYAESNQEDYLHVVLTDEEEVPEAVGRLRVIYPNLMRLSYDNLRTQRQQTILPLSQPEEQTSPMMSFAALYELQNNQPMSEEQEKLLRALAEDIWEVSL